jgi:hypothetical protein
MPTGLCTCIQHRGVVHGSGRDLKPGESVWPRPSPGPAGFERIIRGLAQPFAAAPVLKARRRGSKLRPHSDTRVTY